MTEKECLYFLISFRKEIRKIQWKANAYLTSFWFFVGFIITNAILANPPLYVSMSYNIWLVVYTFIIVLPAKEILFELSEIIQTVHNSIDVEKEIYMKDSWELRKYQPFIDHCIELSKKERK